MRGAPFVHLHVASGYSLRHGATTPAALVQAAAGHGMDALALTDRDGLYGAVKFAQACATTGVRPLLGVDLAVQPTEPGPRAAHRTAGSGHGSGRPEPARRTPARGGASIDPRLPRVVLLAADGRGWASLCRLVSAAHLSGERGRPQATLDLIAEHAAGLVVLLGPDSDLGRALDRRRPDLAEAVLDQWRAAVQAATGTPADLVVELVCHRGPGDRARAARLLGFAADRGVPAVLTNAVRGSQRRDGPILDVLDAVRRLVPLDARHVDRVNAEAYLKPSADMAEIAAEVVAAAGHHGRYGSAADLLGATRRLAQRCVLDPQADLGLGVAHPPELPARDRGSGASIHELEHADRVLRQRCQAGLGRRALTLDLPSTVQGRVVRDRLDSELAIIAGHGFATYFLAIAEVVDLVKEMGVRCAARGSGAGSLVTYLLGISEINPLEHRLLMERFLSPRRRALPDIDLDVESHRRGEVYQRILDHYGGDRCTCVSMMDTYRARHAIRDVGAALGLPPGEIGTLATSFPHIRASQVRAALHDLPELRASGLVRHDGGARLELLLDLVERLDGLPRHVALHPCGVLLSDRTLLDRTPVEASWQGYPMSQFDKDDVEALGLLKLDVLGIRMQSAISHTLAEVERVDGERIDIDAVSREDSGAFELIRSTRTLGCFQIESPGQRELVGKFAPETFDDIIIDISLFRPGPVKSDMVVPFLRARQGWSEPVYLHEDLRDCLEQTCGVVVFHEQVLEIVAVLTGATLADADELRRALGDPAGLPQARAWFIPAALEHGYSLAVVERAWEVLVAFGSFGFCKAHAAAFALPTYQSAYLKAHHTAAFLAGVLTHDPGMYPKRLILDDARQFGIAVLPLDVNVSDGSYRAERLGSGYGIRLSLADVKGITEAELTRIVAGRPYASLSDFFTRAAVSRPVVERLVLAGGFDAVYGIGSTLPVRRRGRVGRRDLLLQVADLDLWRRSAARSARSARPSRGGRATRSAGAATGTAVTDRAARQSQAAAPVTAPDVQLTLDFGTDLLAGSGASSGGLRDLTAGERVAAELEVLGLDASQHVLTGYESFLAALGVTKARDLLRTRSGSDIVVAGVKVATQTPPIRSGRRVVFVTLDDATGPIDATFFESAQVGNASTLFHSWLLVVRGRVRRTGPRGVSLNASGCWELATLRRHWEVGGIAAVEQALAAAPGAVSEAAVAGAADSRSSRPVMAKPPARPVGGRPVQHSTGARSSPYADVAPAGPTPGGPPRKLWHSSPGSSGG